MVKAKRELVKIADLTQAEKLYPRMQTQWLTAYQYAQAMKAGSVFPPIVVGLFKEKKYVIDGWHRIKAMQSLKEEYIEAIVKPFDSEKEMFAEAVRLNTTHGRRLSVQERVRIIAKLETYNFSLEQIKEIVKIPIEQVKKLKARVLIGPNGKPIYLKSVVDKSLDLGDVDASEVVIHQERFSIRNVEQLLAQVIVFLESDVLSFKEDNVKALGLQAYNLLGDKLGLTVEATS